MAPESRIDELTARYAENPRRYFAPLANEYRKLGDPERAIALCRVHLPSQPGHMSGHIVLGQALFDAGELAAARTAFATAVALDDENLVALRQLGDIARLEGDHAEARTWYARVLDADPQQPEVEALMATLAAEAAEREAQARDAAAVAADAESRPLPAPTGTPFPGGIGFSEEELDAFIAHVPVVPGEGQGESDGVTAEVADASGPGVAASPDAASDERAPGEWSGERSPVEAAEVADAAPADDVAGAIVHGDAEREGVAAAEVGDEPASGGVAAEGAEDAAASAVAPADGSFPTADIGAPDVVATAGEPPAVGEAVGAAVGDAVAEEAEAELGAREPEPLLPVDDPAWASATPIESPWTVPADEGAGGPPGADGIQRGDDGDAVLAPLAEAEALMAGPMGDEDEASLPIVDIASLAPDELAASVEPAPAVEAGVTAIEFEERGPIESEASEPASGDGAPAEPETVVAATESAPAGRAVTPVRAAALRLLSSLAPWRDGATPVSGAASVAAPADGSSVAVEATTAGSPEPAEAHAEPVEAESAPVRAEVPATDATDSADAVGASAAIEADAVAADGVAAGTDGTAPAVHDAATLPDAPPSAAAPVAAGAGAGALIDAAPALADEGDADESLAPVAGAGRPTPASFTTATMAELYRRQGFIAEALAVYKELAEREPGDAWYRAQVVALAQELAQRTPQVPSQVVDSKVNEDNGLGVDASSAPEGAAGSLTPPGFASIAPALAESATLAPEPAAGASADGDWFGDVHEPAPDDWFGDVVPADAAAVDELFGMEPTEPVARPAVPTPISLDALGGGLEELFGVPVIASPDAAAAAWLESLAGELVGRAAGVPESLPVPEAFDVPRGGGTASAPGPLLSFDRFFGPTPPSVRRQEEGAPPPLPPVSIGPSFGGTPLVAPRPAEPASWERPSAPPPPVPPAPSEVKPPPSEFHKWLEGLT